MDNLIIRPSYVSLFNCIGPACEDSCCNDWNITFDKKSYKTTLKITQLADIARTAFKETKKNANDWADIRLNAQGACPFVNQDKLCAIHAIAGEKALSQTCKSYPRTSTLVGGDKYESLYMSCPEVARLVLFNADAFQFNALASGVKHTAQPSPTWVEKTYQYSLDLLINLGLDWQQAMLAIGLLINVSEQVSQNLAPLSDLDKRFEQLSSLAAAGLLTQQYQKIPYTPQPQMHAFVSIHNALCKSHSRSLRPRFTQLNQAIALLCNEDNGYQIERINQAWSDYAAPALTKYADLFDRYMLYSMYHNHFPLLAGQAPWSAFRLLLVDCFMIRCYLSAIAYKNKGLSESDIVLCFQVYQIVRQHQQQFADTLSTILQECGIDSVPAAISLLKTEHNEALKAV